MTEITQLEAMNWKAKAISRGKLLDRFRADMREIVDHAENEGDRVYLGSTNHFDHIRDAVEEMEMWNWDRIMRERSEVDPYAEMRKLRGENDRLRTAIDQIASEASATYCSSLRQFEETECLGWEAKVESGKFGEDEHDAHRKANLLMGKSQGLWQAEKIARAALETKS